jgi:imidazolonepropionase-like amidohydrolase
MSVRDGFTKSLFILILILSIAVSVYGQTKRIRSASEHLIFKCKVLINPASGKNLENAVVEVNNGRILRVGKIGDLKIPEGVKVMDNSDKYIIPGLIDTHAHLFGGVTIRHTTCDMLPIFYLAAGVTTVRSPGSMDPEGDMAMRNRIDSGRFLGPRCFLSGPYIEMEPVTVAWMNPVQTPEETRLKIDQWSKQGATSVKIYAAMHGEILRAAIEHGHGHGLKVIAHVGAVTYKEAIEMGIDELFHGIIAMPDTRPKGIDQRARKQWSKLTSELDLTQPEIQEILRLAAESRVVLCPTAVIQEHLDMEEHHMDEQKKYFTPEAWEKIEERVKKPVQPQNEKIMEKNIQFIKMAHDAGCILAIGTDLTSFSMLPGYSLWREMEIFAEAGIEPMEILKAATINGAFAIGRTDQIGSVEPGKLADFVILNANPLENISNSRSVHRVVKEGIIYEPEKLLKPLIGKFH